VNSLRESILEQAQTKEDIENEETELSSLKGAIIDLEADMEINDMDLTDLKVVIGVHQVNAARRGPCRFSAERIELVQSRIALKEKEKERLIEEKAMMIQHFGEQLLGLGADYGEHWWSTGEEPSGSGSSGSGEDQMRSMVAATLNECASLDASLDASIAQGIMDGVKALGSAALG
jgi:hypothetical protein